MLTYHHAPAFLRRLLAAARVAPGGVLTWSAINDLAARHLDGAALRPGESASRLGHVFAAQLVESGILAGDIARQSDGSVFVAEVRVAAPQALAA